MKVLHVITGLAQGGAEAVLASVIGELRSETDFVVVSLMSKGVYGGRLEKLGVPVFCVGMKKRPGDLFKLWKLYRIIRREKPDVVQTWMYHANLFGGIAARMAGVKRIVWGLHHSTLDRRHDSFTTLLIARLGGLFSPCLCDRIISCSKRAAKIHIDANYSRKRMIVVPNGYAVERFAPNADKRELARKACGFPEDAVVFGLAARYNPQKDHATFLHAAMLVKKAATGRRALFAMCGDGVDEQNEEIKRLVDECGLASDIALMGRLDDMPAFMNAIDFNVLSSSHGEAFPNVLCEAMACGTPCIATDVGDCAEILADTGWIVSPRAPEKLAEAMLAAMNEPASRAKERRVAARARIVENYDIRKIAQEYYKIWTAK
jgi:glycosyltransferase involved in cell wall biosynthesis